jgi:hypothetical protein
VQLYHKATGGGGVMGAKMDKRLKVKIKREIKKLKVLKANKQSGTKYYLLSSDEILNMCERVAVWYEQVKEVITAYENPTKSK